MRVKRGILNCSTRSIGGTWKHGREKKLEEEEEEQQDMEDPTMERKDEKEKSVVFLSV